MRTKHETAGASEQSAIEADAALVLACHRGDRRAFVEIVTRYQAMVCGITFGILDDFAASEDAAQETFLTAWRKIGNLRQPERLKAWLGQIARHTALLQLRRSHEYAPLNETLQEADQEAAPDITAIQKEEAALVCQALAMLPETYRLPLVLYYRDDQSVKAVAEALELSEDAVRQRLVRGREMLREQMLDLVETVLERSKPRAMFTMAVAAAIGALAAPETLAGTVFGSASAVAGSSSSSSTSFITAMSASKNMLIAATLAALACVPIGYQLHRTMERPAAAKSLAPAQSVRRPTAPEYENGALFAEWRDLHRRYGTNAQAMPVLYKAIDEMKIPFRRRAFHAALIAEWAQLAPEEGMKFFSAKGRSPADLRQFFEECFSRDPNRAAQELMAVGPGWETVARDCLTEIARKAPSLVPAIAAKLPAPQDNYWHTSVRDAFAILAEGDLDSARAAAEALSGPNREQALSGIARTWAKTDFSKALAWTRTLPEGTDRDEILRAAILGRATVDPVGALEEAGTLPAGGHYFYFASTTGARVLDEAGKANLETTISWLVSHPGRMNQQDLLGLAGDLTGPINADAAGFLDAHASEAELKVLWPAIENTLLNRASGQFAAIWDWFRAQPETPLVSSIRNDLVFILADKNPELGLGLADELQTLPDSNALTKEMEAGLFNRGNKLCRFDELYAQASDPMRESLLETAFDLLGTDNLDNPQKWVSRLALLPESSQAKAAESLARAWAEQTPEEALEWATSLSAGQSRQGALAAIISAWAATDASNTADWVASLPAGAERDSAVTALAASLATRYPNQAWDWALSIGDNAKRSQAAFQVVQAEAARAPDLALQWLQTGPFTTETRARLESILAQAGSSSATN